MIRLSVSLVAVALLAGCPANAVEPEVFLNAMTAAPPTKTAAVFNPYDGDPSIELSSGIGLGIGCVEYCPDAPPSGPDCATARITVSPPDLATTYPVSLPGREGAVVLVGGEPGAGAVTVTTSCAEKRYRLEVRP